MQAFTDGTLELYEYGSVALPLGKGADYREVLASLSSGGTALRRSIDWKAVPCLAAQHHVGLFPVRWREGDVSLQRLAVSLPKGAKHGSDADGRLTALVRFGQLLALASDTRIPPSRPVGTADGWRAAPDTSLGLRFALLLAFHFASLVDDVIRHDLRRYYRVEEDTLIGRIRGRLVVSGHARNALRGRAHHAPCVWEEFTLDNWDNRILKAACRELRRRLLVLSDGALTHDPLGRVLVQFGDVEDVSIRIGDLGLARLGRLSRRHRAALEWARLVLGGMGAPDASGSARALQIDTNAVFERFARVIVKRAAARLGLRATNGNDSRPASRANLVSPSVCSMLRFRRQGSIGR